MPVTMSKITNFFMPRMSSDGGKHSNTSSNSNNNNKDEGELPPRQNLKSTFSDTVGKISKRIRKRPVARL